MKFVLLTVGKTDASYLLEGISLYEKRIIHYVPFERIELPDPKNIKNLSQTQRKEREAELILNEIQQGDFLVLLDERGKRFTSLKFAEHIEKKMHLGAKRVVFLIGGPYGFAESIYQRANEKLTLSDMTFSHQMIRLLFIEQFYRAMTILRNEPYHHE